MPVRTGRGQPSCSSSSFLPSLTYEREKCYNTRTMSTDIQVIRDDGTVSKTALYRSMCRRIFKGNLPNTIENKRTSYALIVIQELIRMARFRVDIYCQGGEDYFWEDYTTFDEMTSACDEREVKFRVISRKPLSRQSQANFERCDAEIYKPKQGSESSFRTDMLFVVVDGRALHLETSPCDHSGIALADSPKNAESLEKVFRALLGKCERVR